MVIGTHVFRWKAVETDSSKQMLTTLHSTCTSERGTKARVAVSVTVNLTTKPVSKLEIESLSIKKRRIGF